MTARIKRREFIAALTTGVAAVGSSRVLAKNKSSAARDLVLNPYEGTDHPDVQQLRGNLHTHSLWHNVQKDGSIIYANGEIIGPNGETVRPPVASYGHRNPHPDFSNAEGRQAGSDGGIRPDELIDAYQREGYDFLSLTDHDRVTWPWQAYGKDPEDLGMVAIIGNELSRNIHHTLSLFTDYAPKGDGRTLEGVLKGLGQAGGLGVIAHPTRDWPLHFLKKEVRSLEIPLDPGLREITTGDFTIESWFCTEDSGRNILFGNYDSFIKIACLNLELQANNRVRVFFSSGQRGGTVNLDVPADSIGVNTRDGQWHHLAAVRRGDTMTLYLNGQQVGQTGNAALRVPLGGEVLFIGRDYRTDKTVFEGLLDHVRFWDRALSPAEVTGVQTGAVPRSGLVRQYAFNPADPAAVKQGRLTKEMLADTAGHRSGPGAANASATGAPRVELSVPPALQQSGLSTASLRFGDGSPSPADGVPGYVLDHYEDLYNRYPHLIGMEVLNGTRSRDFAGDRALWDDLLARMMPGRPVWGLATDDIHDWRHFAKDWVSVLSPKRDVGSIRKSMERGSFFFSSVRPLGDAASSDQTPVLRSVRHDRSNGTLSAEATLGGRSLLERDAFAWIADGQVVQTGPQLHYREVNGIHNYVRLEVTGPGGISFTNPFGFRKGVTH